MVRRGQPQDLGEVAAVQEASPAAAQWDVAEYLQYDFRVWADAGRVAGFLVSRRVAEGEREVLNLAVLPDYRRRGVARALLESLLPEACGDVFLEVRESNLPARDFYKSMGFQEIGNRSGYYDHPMGASETAIVMKFHSC